MSNRRHHFAIASLLLVSQLILSQPERKLPPDENCLGCPPIVLKGKLSKWLEVSECKAISGMTCRIWFNKGAVLPSRIFIYEVDAHEHPVGKRRALIYPNLKLGEKGWATFRISRGSTVVLTGEWNGPWKSAY